MTIEYIFLFAVSPVQSYIAQARKTQDLYAGSMILSRLCRTAFGATELPEERLLFPQIDRTSEEQSLPNRFIAIITEEDITELKGTDEKDRLHRLGTKAAEAVKDTFMGIAKTVSEPFESNIPENFFEQVKHYLDINWLFLPYQEADYEHIHPRIERLLQGVKQVRTFTPLPEQGRKCAICGERNVKVYRKSSTDGSTKHLLNTKLFTSPEKVLVVEETADSPIREKFLQPGEGICAVCYMKRSAELAFPTMAAFPSTSTLAMSEALYRLEQKTEKSFSSYTDQITNLALLFKHSPAQAEQEAKNTQELRKAQKLVEELKKQEIDFGPYYALLLFDGDSMGKWLSGTWLQNPQQLAPFHRALSDRLRQFAQHAREECLTWPHGRAVYAGGDDFLGFVNIASLFEVLGTLRKAFDEQVNESLFQGEQRFELTEPDRRMSFSAGVAVAHYKTPLGEVLKWARLMEQEAKHVDSKHTKETEPANSERKEERKDAFAITVLKHSGDIRQMVFHWRPPDALESPLATELCQDVMAPILAGTFSSKFFRVLHKEFQRLIQPDKQMPCEELVRPEVRRLLKRACNISDTAVKEAAVTNMTTAVMNVYDRSRDNFENFLSAFDILDFFIRKDTA